MKYVFAFCFIISGLTAFPQARQNYFVYLQTENKQPFYVKFNKDILSSTSSGYLIVPKLADSTYQFFIGFPAKEWPEQMITISVNKDVGFILKNFNEKGWGLFNLQTFEVVMNGNDRSVKPEKILTATDQFSNLLSEVVNDSTIRQTSSPENVYPKDSFNQISKIPVPIAMDSQEVSKVISIKKISSEGDSNNLQMTYIDGGTETDTINASLDLSENLSLDKKDSANLLLAGEPLTPDTVLENPVIIPEEKDTLGMISIQNPIPVKNDTLIQMDFLSVKTPMINSNCTQNAVQLDVEKLERKMVSESSDDSKVKVARKILKTKCFSTQYIRQLSRLFITSAGKYNFFDMAYPYVSDSGLYNTLESEILDAYYLKRFQALINK